MKTDQSPEPIPAKDLHGLFAPKRPDPDAFRAGVEKRIAQRRAAEQETGEQGQRPGNTMLLRRVAAVLPMDPFSGGKVGSAATKLLYSALAVPALVLGSAIGGFVVSARSLKRETGFVVPMEDEPVDWRQKQISALNDDLLRGRQLLLVVQCGLLVTLLVSFLMGGRIAIDALTGVLLVAMGIIVLVTRGLAKEGLLSRRTTARSALFLLLEVFGGCFVWMSTLLAVPDGHATLGFGWASCAVLLGMTACATLGWGARRGVLVFCLATFLAVLTNSPAITGGSPTQLQDQLAAMDLDPRSLERWEAADAIFKALESVGESTPDLSAQEARLAEAIEQGIAMHPVVWTAAAHMGLISDPKWSRIAEDRLEGESLDRLLEENRPIHGIDYYEYLIPMLLATRNLSPEQRERVAANAQAAWPSTGEYGALGDAAMLVRVFEWLELPERVQSQAPAIRELLIDHWVGHSGSGLYIDTGGFTPDPAEFDNAFIDATWAAIELMARVGVPDEIDGFELRGFLEKESRPWPLVFELFPDHHAIPRAALLRLERELGMPERSWFEILLAERLLIATLLLVTLCLLAIRLSPAHPEPFEGGAQP